MDKKNDIKRMIKSAKMNALTFLVSIHIRLEKRDKNYLFIYLFNCLLFFFLHFSIMNDFLV